MEPITESRFILYRDQQSYLDDGWQLTPQRGRHATFGVIASRPAQQVPLLRT